MLTMTDAELLLRNPKFEGKVVSSDAVKVLRELQYYTVRGMVEKYFEVLNKQHNSIQGLFSTAILFTDGKENYSAPSIFLGFAQHPELMKAFSEKDRHLIFEMFSLPMPFKVMSTPLHLVLMQQVLCEVTKRCEVQQKLLSVLKQSSQVTVVSEVSNETILDLQSQLAAANSRAEELSKEVVALKEARISALKKTTDELLLVRASVEKEKASFIKATKEIQDLQQRLHRGGLAKLDLEKQVSQLRAENLRIAVERDRLSDQVMKRSSDITDLNDACVNLAAELSSLRIEHQRLEGSHSAELQEHAYRIEGMRLERSEEVRKLKNNNAQLHQQVNEQSVSLRTLSEQNVERSLKIFELEKQCDHLRSIIRPQALQLSTYLINQDSILSTTADPSCLSRFFSSERVVSELDLDALWPTSNPWNRR